MRESPPQPSAISSCGNVSLKLGPEQLGLLQTQSLTRSLTEPASPSQASEPLRGALQPVDASGTLVPRVSRCSRRDQRHQTVTAPRLNMQQYCGNETALLRYRAAQTQTCLLWTQPGVPHPCADWLRRPRGGRGSPRSNRRRKQSVDVLGHRRAYVFDDGLSVGMYVAWN